MTSSSSQPNTTAQPSGGQTLDMQTMNRQTIAACTTVGVIGAGVSGKAALRLLRVLLSPSARLIVVDSRAGELQELAAAFHCEVTAQLSQLAEAMPQLIVVSPGVSFDHPVYQLKGPAIIAEVDLAYLACPQPMIGVTGTNGKSTVTQLIADIGRGLGLESTAGGNIGIAAAELAATQITREKAAKSQEGAAGLWIVELSSYQLEQSRHLKLEGAVFTSFSEDHQERHKNLENYFRAKWEIINRISTGGFLVIHKETLSAIAAQMPGIWQRFPWRPDLHIIVIEKSGAASLEAENLGSSDLAEIQDSHCLSDHPLLSKYFLHSPLFSAGKAASGQAFAQASGQAVRDEQGTVVQALDQAFCQYGHNVTNAALAVLCCRQILQDARAATTGRPASTGGGAKTEGYDAAKVTKVLDQFTGLAYRFQPLCATEALAIINDSKSTNIESLDTALASIHDADIILLVGGVAGSPSYIKVNHYQDKLKWVLCFGKDGDKIYKELNSIPRKSLSPDLGSALDHAIQLIDDHVTNHQEREDLGHARRLVVLFSPGCKSFDEFTSFMERGAFFERAITQAKGYERWRKTR